MVWFLGSSDIEIIGGAFLLTCPISHYGPESKMAASVHIGNVDFDWFGLEACIFVIFRNAQIPLHNFVTKQVMNDTVNVRYLKLIEKSEEEYQKFRSERYIEKSKKLSDKISMVKLPEFDADPTNQKKNSGQKATVVVVSTKDIAVAAREIELAILRGMSSREVYTHGLLESSALFLGDNTPNLIWQNW